MNTNFKKLRAAFIGGGSNSEIGFVHKNALDISQRYSLESACFSTNKKINFTTGNMFGIPNNKIYENIDQLLINEQSNLDVVIILTPTDRHYENIMKVLEYNIPVVSEKSLAMNAQEVKKIKQKLLIKKNSLSITYNYTGYPMVRELKKFISKKMIGQVNQFLIEMPQDSLLKVDNKNKKSHVKSWRLKKFSIPMIYFDLGSHIHSIIAFILNKKIKKVLCVSNNYGHFRDIDDDVHCLLELDRNCLGNIWFSKSALGNNNGLKIRIYGNKGSVEWYQEHPDHFLYSDKFGQKQIINLSSNLVKVASQKRYNRFKPGHPTGFVEAFANYYEDIARKLQRKNTIKSHIYGYVLGIDEAENGIKFIESMYLSKKKRKWINVS